MITTEKSPIRIAILDLNDGFPNQGMRCIRQIIDEWSATITRDVTRLEFEVRQKNEIPDNSFDIYISSGGPGDPLSTRFDDWDIAWCKWVDEMIGGTIILLTPGRNMCFSFAILFNLPAAFLIRLSL